MRTIVPLLWILLAAPGLWAGQVPFMPPPLEIKPPELILEHAEDGCVDEKGKIWGWSSRNFLDQRPDRQTIERAWKSDLPTLVKGASLVMVDGAMTIWMTRKNSHLLFYDGIEFREYSLNNLTYSGSATKLSQGCWALGTYDGICLCSYQGITCFKLITTQSGYSFLNDQAGRTFAYSPQAGSILRIEQAQERTPPYQAKAIPVMDSPEQPVGMVVRHPDGNPEYPALLAGGRLLTGVNLESPVTDEAVGQRLLKDLESEDFQVRAHAFDAFLNDGKNGRWQWGDLLCQVKIAEASQDFLTLYRKLILDRVARFEPGRSFEYAGVLQQLGYINSTIVREKGSDYKNLWIALEEAGAVERETRVGYERARREDRLEWQRLRDRRHAESLLPFPVGGVADHEFACQEYIDSLDGGDCLRDLREDRPGETLWMAMLPGGIWLVTRKAEEARVLQWDPHSLGAIRKILGRLPDGRLLVQGGVLVEKEWRTGIWALRVPAADELPPKPEKK